MKKYELGLRNHWLRVLRLGALAVATSVFLGGLQASAEEPEKAPESPPAAAEAESPKAAPPPEAAEAELGRTRGMSPSLKRVPDPDDLQRVPDPDDLDASEPEANDP